MNSPLADISVFLYETTETYKNGTMTSYITEVRGGDSAITIVQIKISR